MKIKVYVPNIGLIVKIVLGYMGFGYCTSCGTKLKTVGWYEEKTICSDCLKER